MRTAFWASAFFIAYVYVGYALLLMLWARLKGTEGTGRVADAAGTPTVSIVIAARNEARRLSSRLAWA